MNKNTKKIRDLAAYVCDRLDGKVLIHRYDAYSTNSVYLKFDYGVANSLRIADHAGKKHLAYPAQRRRVRRSGLRFPRPHVEK